MKETNSNNVGIAMMVKIVGNTGKVKQMILVGDVKGKECVIVDDFLATGDTMLSAAEMLRSKGAKRVIGIATHMLLTEKLMKRVENSDAIDLLLTTNSIDINFKTKKIVQLSVSELLAEAIWRLHNGVPLENIEY